MTQNKKSTLGIIAGDGTLPLALVKACQAQKRPFFVLALRHHTPDSWLTSDIPHAFVRLGALGRAFRLLKQHHVKEVVFIGGIRRPSFREILPDLCGWRFLLSIGFQAWGDNHLLSLIIRRVEQEGFHVVGADSIVPALLIPGGCLTAIHPSDLDQRDIQHGLTIARILGQADIGQAVIVQQGLVLAVEGIEGTARLIARTASLRRKGPGGTLIKVAKPQQDRRVDLPTIGPETIQALHDGGFVGVAVGAGSTLLAEAEKTLLLADRLGLFIVGVDANDSSD